MKPRTLGVVVTDMGARSDFARHVPVESAGRFHRSSRQVPHLEDFGPFRRTTFWLLRRAHPASVGYSRDAFSSRRMQRSATRRLRRTESPSAPRIAVSRSPDDVIPPLRDNRVLRASEQEGFSRQTFVHLSRRPFRSGSDFLAATSDVSRTKASKP